MNWCGAIAAIPMLLWFARTGFSSMSQAFMGAQARAVSRMLHYPSRLRNLLSYAGADRVAALWFPVRTTATRTCRLIAMKDQIPDFTWYSAVSAKAKLPPRCPIASAELCPRYYASLWLLGDARITTPISVEDQKRLDRKWAPFKPSIAEEEAGIALSGGKLVSVSKFCPEATELVFGLFAQGLYRYADELDSGFAHKKLAQEGAPLSDPRWAWSAVTPCHYTECREYSIFSEMTSGSRKAAETRTRRAGLRPRTRWQVMARDSFTCHYCGRRPPDVILEVDHMISVTGGGRDDIENLITACLECNRGKGASSVVAELPPVATPSSSAGGPPLPQGL